MGDHDRVDRGTWKPEPTPIADCRRATSFLLEARDSKSLASGADEPQAGEKKTVASHQEKDEYARKAAT